MSKKILFLETSKTFYLSHKDQLASMQCDVDYCGVANTYNYAVDGVPDLIIYGSLYAGAATAWEFADGKVMDRVPLIWVNASNEHVDSLFALETVADDTVNADIDSQELRARVRAVMRRVDKYAEVVAQKNRFNIYSFCGLTVDESTRRVTDQSGKRLSFNGTELKLLTFLLENRKNIVSREALIEAVSDGATISSNRVIDVKIFRLRKKLHRLLGNKEIIRTVHKKGYVLAAEVEVTQVPEGNASSAAAIVTGPLMRAL